MKKPGRLLFVLMLLGGQQALAADAVMELTEQVLNDIVYRMGVLSDGGVGQPYSVVHTPELFEICHHVGYMDCPGLFQEDFGFIEERIPLVLCRSKGGGFATLPEGEPLPWQWWITDARFELAAGSMTFTATVTTKVGSTFESTTRTVDASAGFNVYTNTLLIDIDDFSVALEVPGNPDLQLDAGPVDVSAYYSITVPAQPQTFEVVLPTGGTKTVTGNVVSASPRYLPGTLEMRFDVDFD